MTPSGAHWRRKCGKWTRSINASTTRWTGQGNRYAPNRMLRILEFQLGSLADMREAAARAEIVAADVPQLSTVLVSILRRYSKNTHQST